MTPDELRPILAGYKAQVEKAWSKATAAPGFEGADGSPVGQCGVTSAWLHQRLREDRDLETLYCTGNLYPTPTSTGLAHCWLEHIDGRFVVIDLTADQFGDEPVVCTTYRDLVAQGIHYIAQDGAYDPPGSIKERLALLGGVLA